MRRRPKFYVSSTYVDLKGYREEVLRTLRRAGFPYHSMENDSAEPERPAEKCVADVLECDAYIGLVAWRYGQPPPGFSLSVTELEYDAAKTKKLPTLIFLVSPDHPWPPGFVDPNRHNVQRFRDRLCAENTVAFFGSAEDLAREVGVALAQYSTKHGSGHIQEHGNFLEEVRAYKNWCLESLCVVSSVASEEDATFDLSEVYIPLRVSMRQSAILQPSDALQDLSAISPISETHEITVETLLEGNPARSHRVILGDAGSGKTTVLKRLMQKAIVRAHNDLGQSNDTVPVFVSLRKVNGTDLSLPIEDFLYEMHQRVAPGLVTSDFFHRCLQQGSLLLLADGLDEIADDVVREGLCRYLETLASARTTNVQIVTTSRYSAYGGAIKLDRRFLVVDIRPFDKASARLFVRTWFVAANRTSQYSGSHDRQPKQLLEMIDSREPRFAPFRALLSCPLLLSLACALSYRGQDIPGKRSAFFRRTIDLLADRSSSAPGSGGESVAQLATGLAKFLAYHMHTHHRRDDLTESEANVIIGNQLKGTSGLGSVKPGDVFGWLHKASGLLTEYSPGRYGFLHLALQEYLAAAHIANEGEPAIRELGNAISQKWWWNVSFIFAEDTDRMSFEYFARSILSSANVFSNRRVLQSIFGAAGPSRLGELRNALRDPARSFSEREIIAHILTGAGGHLSDAVFVAIKSGDNQELMSALLTCNMRSTTRAARDVLVGGMGSISAHHFSDPVTNVKFLQVEGGTFFRGAVDIPFAAPEHAVRMSPFWIGETPITNAQYAVFLNATQFEEPAFWREARFSLPEQPVVGVNWYDAIAFCEWLSRRLRLAITLPTEAQWEYAARGTDRRTYPWGETLPDATLACFGRYEADDHPAVSGAFPLGRGPFGTLDQAGNVWEWCLDTWDPNAYSKTSSGLLTDPLVLHDEEGSRVLRGGNWWFVADALKSAYRFRNPAANRNDDIGFRIVTNNLERTNVDDTNA